MNDEFIKMEQQLTGKIGILEMYSPHGIVEWDLVGMKIINVNRQFDQITGWCENTLTELMGTKETTEEKSTILINSLFHHKFVEEFQQTLMDGILHNDNDPSRSKVWMKHKDGHYFPVSLSVNVLSINRVTRIAQIFISDETDVQDMLGTIREQNTTINRLVEYFAVSRTEYESTSKLIEYLHAIRSSIYDEQR